MLRSIYEIYSQEEIDKMSSEQKWELAKKILPIASNSVVEACNSLMDALRGPNLKTDPTKDAAD